MSQFVGKVKMKHKRKKLKKKSVLADGYTEVNAKEAKEPVSGRKKPSKKSEENPQTSEDDEAKKTVERKRARSEAGDESSPLKKQRAGTPANHSLESSEHRSLESLDKKVNIEKEVLSQYP